MKKRLILIIIPVLVAVVVLGLILGLRSRVPAGEVWANGTVEGFELSIAPKVGGRLAVLETEEGDLLKRGQLIAALDDRDFRAQVTQARGALAAASAQLAADVVGPRIERIQAARAALAQAEANVTGAEKALITARLGYRRSTELKEQLDQARADLDAAEAARRQAVAYRDQIHTGARPQEKREAAAQAAQAQATLEGAIKARDTALQDFRDVTALKTQLDAAEANLKVARAGVDSARATLENARTTDTRIENLYEAGAASRQQRDDAQERLRVAEAARDHADAALRGAEAAVADARKAYDDRLAQKGSRDAAETQVAVAEKSLERAREALSLLLEGSREEQVRQADAQLEQAQARVEGARKTLANAQQAYDDRLVHRSQVETAQTQCDMARAQRDLARAQLDELLHGSRPETIEAARGDTERARGALAQAEVSLEDTRICAPTDGTVTDVVSRPGEMVAPGLPVIKMVNLLDLWVKVYLPLPRLGAVVVGDPASIASEGLPGETFRGKIIQIANMAEFTPKNVQTAAQRERLVYYVKVGIENPEGKLKPGMPAEVRIKLR